MKDIILVGIQGSGKGTQAKILVDKFGYQLLETGSFFRDLRNNDSDLARRVIATIDQGHYVDDATVMEIVKEKFSAMDFSRPILFDGIPRSEPQRVALEELLDQHKREYQVISISITQEEAFARLTKRSELEGRRDDSPEGIKSRIDLFHELTRPMIQSWEKQGRVKEIEGNGTIEQISQRIAQEIQGPRCKKCTCGK